MYKVEGMLNCTRWKVCSIVQGGKYAQCPQGGRYAQMYKVEGMHNALKVESMQRRREVCTGGAYVSHSLNAAFVAARCLVVIRPTQHQLWSEGARRKFLHRNLWRCLRIIKRARAGPCPPVRLQMDRTHRTIIATPSIVDVKAFR